MVYDFVTVSVQIWAKVAVNLRSLHYYCLQISKNVPDNFSAYLIPYSSVP